ncbi:MAG: replicative DNA helicase, partial [Desulfobacteraceae bacterium]|nr:replicative DNA helicase [Desulfobacteraceae bacterium]
DAEGLTSRDFYRSVHQHIFTAVEELHRKRQIINQFTVAEQLQAMGKLEEVGGRAYLAQLLDYVTGEAFTELVKKVLAYSIKRQMIITLAKHTDKVHSGGDANELLDNAQRDLMAIGADRATAAPETIAATCDGLIDDLESIQAGRRGLGLQTGFAKLDEVTGGLQPGELILLAARPSMGKTALALIIGQNAAVGGKRVLFFSLEQPRKQLALRLLARATGISVSALRSGKLSPEEWEKINDARAQIVGLPLTIDDRSGLHIRDIQRTARRMARDGLGLLVVDYIQLCHGDRAERKDLEVGQISAGLKSLAKDLNIPVLALSQLSREVERRTDKWPQLSDLRESGALEQDADVVCFLYNPNRYTKAVQEHTQAAEVELLVEKNRQGRIGHFKLLWRAWLTSFDNI